MTLDQETELSPAETDALLARHQTGVLSLAHDDEPYAIPVSYGYDADARRIYLRLVSTPDSEKRRFLDGAPRASLVVYEHDDDGYRSAVAAGRLSVVEREDLMVEHVEQYGDAKRPLFEVWDEERPDLDIALYRFDPERISARRIVPDDG
jgi:nitroimidazol reductase NimA-like FMN-containing flavoprotein (pyridoxamine 5'-phosphate oxidase superfamily)